MAEGANFSLVAAVNDAGILHQNLYRSPDILGGHVGEIILKQDYPSAARAYNAALDEARNDLVVFVHQDIYLPGGWFSNLSCCMQQLERSGVEWGVLGCFGVSAGFPNGVGRIYSTGWGRIGRVLAQPEPVETLDEIVLVLRKSSGLRFDEDMPHFHLYGADICLSARDKGKVSYAFPGYCVHNTNQLLTLPEEFYVCYRYVRRKWHKFLPIQTPCIRLSWFNERIYLRKLEDIGGRLLRKTRTATRRVDDPTPFATDVFD